MQKSANLPKINGGNTFVQRRADIFKRLQGSAEQCQQTYAGRKNLASENDDVVAELCEALEDAFSYGLRQQNSVTVTAASLFQNMQEIMTGNAGVSSTAHETMFWDFCQVHLTPDERKRFVDLKHVWTKYGRGRAFIRAALNENSLQRYLLSWLSDREQLAQFYTHWSLLLDEEMSKQLPNIMQNLNDILFALSVDTTELNAGGARCTNSSKEPPRKEEPIIVAPSPVPVAAAKSNRRKKTAVERPIATANSTEDLINAFKEALPNGSLDDSEVCTDDLAEISALPPPDPIEPELAFLKEDLVFVTDNSDNISDDRSETSSQYSKSSSNTHTACTSQNAALEEQLRQMSERCALLETRVAQLSLENRQLVRRLTRHFQESGIDPNSSLTYNFLITIPHVELKKSPHAGAASYFSYEIHITMRQNLEHWLLHRRYNDFYKLHKSLLKTHPCVSAVEFPPKKRFGNRNLKFVEERRQQLQIYLLNLVEMLPQVEACKTKLELQKVFPFFRER